jgi:hypothetical protein
LALALAGFAGWTLLRPSIAPATLRMALVGGVAVSSIFALGVAGLGLIRGRSPSLVAPGIGALVWSLASLVMARQGYPQLLLLGALNAVFAAGLLSRAVRLDRGPPDRTPGANGGAE